MDLKLAGQLGETIGVAVGASFPGLLLALLSPIFFLIRFPTALALAAAVTIVVSWFMSDLLGLGAAHREVEQLYLQLGLPFPENAHLHATIAARGTIPADQFRVWVVPISTVVAVFLAAIGWALRKIVRGR